MRPPAPLQSGRLRPRGCHAARLGLRSGSGCWSRPACLLRVAMEARVGPDRSSAPGGRYSHRSLPVAPPRPGCSSATSAAARRSVPLSATKPAREPRSYAESYARELNGGSPVGPEQFRLDPSLARPLDRAVRHVVGGQAEPCVELLQQTMDDEPHVDSGPQPVEPN